MRTNRRQFIGGALSVTALSGLPMPAIAQNAPIRIGCITSLVGGYSLFGDAHVRGMQMAAEHLNSQGGVNGRQVEIVVRDDGLKPDVGVAAARELAADGVKIFAGVRSSGVALALSGVAEELDAVFLNCASHGNNLTHEDFHKNYFRITDYSAMRIGAGSQVMAKRYPQALRWGAIANDTALGQSVIDTMNFYLPRSYKQEANADVEIQETVWVKFGATDYRNEIARLMSQGIDGLLVGVGGADEVTFVQQAGQFGLTKQLKAIYTSGSEFQAPRALKDKMPENYWSGFHWYYGAYPDNELAKQLVETYRAKGYGKHPDGFVGMAHTAVMAIAQAIKAGAGDTGKELVPALEGMSFDSIKGKITLRKEDHQAIEDVNYALVGPSTTDEEGWTVNDSARVDGAPFAGPPTPGQPLKFE
jgi:branched-chain amino acid transport system substrate-binding protein